MKLLQPTVLLSTLFFCMSAFYLTAQTTVSGQITDVESGEPLINANIQVKGTGDGTITDFDGNFTFQTNETPPFTLVASYIGYTEQEISVTGDVDNLKIELGESAVTIAAVEVKGRRISEKQKQAALTVETLDNIGIRETPAANFYDGLGSLKEVDLTAASLGFKIINMRGFNSTSPVRSLQLIDGVDNQSPGLNFSLGNFLGASELDVNRVNLVIGASSAFYGPNAFNGVISMETKDPFLQEGLSAMVKLGERNLVEGGFRWAQALSNGEGQKWLAYKLNFYALNADDWEADNYDPVFGTEAGRDNPGGYDAVNIYGDETFDDARRRSSQPGLGIFHRRGYREVDLVDYNSENYKLGGLVQMRLKPEIDLSSPELILASNFSTGTTVYQGDNRFSLKNIKFFQHRLELRKRDKYFLRMYATHEDAGDSYDPYFTALLLQRRHKKDDVWLRGYNDYWSQIANPVIKDIEGFPRAVDYIGRPDEYRAVLSAFLAQPEVRDLVNNFHQQAQDVVGMANPLNPQSQDFFEPGTERFQTAFDDITSRISFAEGGTKFYDKSALFHVNGEYMFNDLASGGNSISDLDLRIGASGRLFTPDSQGSILLDTMGRNINNSEFGIYGGGTIEFNGTLKINASLRFDKNQNFDPLISPAASVVYTPNPDHTLRASFSAAVRNPTLSDQYLFYNVGRAILIGNLDGFDGLATLESFENFLNTGIRDTLDFFNVDAIQPEKVKTLEVGYRTTLFDKIYLDANYYFSFYNDFIGYNLGVVPVISNPPLNQLVSAQAYRVSANATDQVTTQGFSVGMNYYFAKYFVVNGNYSFNKLNTQTDDPIVPAFNTPENKYNVGLAGRDIPFRIGGFRIPNFGFNINYKWIEGFIFEGSPQFTGAIPSYDLLDAQFNFRVNKINTTFKFGASNILDNQVFQTYGGPRIGRLAYFSMLYDFRKK